MEYSYYLEDILNRGVNALITCALRGGLGNQMFQIATTSALAWRNKDTAVFDPENHHLPLQGRTVCSYTNNIFNAVNFQSPLKYDSIYKSPDFGYTTIPYTSNMMLVGYFQSEKYFSDYRKKIIKMFYPSNTTREYITNKYGKLNSNNVTSIHIRRGDYLNFSTTHPLCEEAYYVEAINCFPKDTEYLILSDDPNWCRNTFRTDRFKVVEEEKDYIDMYLMSMCKNNIIANSSFSWWGAWLNNAPDKTIVAPKKWFGPAINHDTDDLIPGGWIRL